MQKGAETEAGEVTIKVPCDCQGTFEPQMIGKDQTRHENFDAQIIAMYALGRTVRDIQTHLHEIYGVAVSAALMLDALCPIVT